MEAPAEQAADLKQVYDAYQMQEIRERAAQVERMAFAQELGDWGYVLYFALFALGAALLVGWAFWPRHRVLTLRGWADSSALPAGVPAFERAHAGCAAAMLVLVLCAISHQRGIDSERGFIEDRWVRMDRDLREAERRGPQAVEEVVKSHYLYLPEGDALHYLFLGNDSLAADAVWLTSLQYVSSPFRRGQKFEMMYRFYETVLDLDPRWVTIHARAGKLLSAIDPDRYRAERFFMRSIAANPEDWVLPMEAGRLFVVPPERPSLLRDYSTRSANYFETALRRESLPAEMRVSLKDMVARLRSEGEDYDIAAQYLWEVASNRENPKPLRDSASRAWLQAESLLRVQRVRERLEAFRKSVGQAPPKLGALFDRPEYDLADAYGYPIALDPKSGEPYSDGYRCQRALQASTVIQTLIAIYRRERGQYPPDLNDLTLWVREYFKPPNHATFPMLEALGEELDCATNPMGGTWDYKPDTGTIELPPRASANRLFANVDMALDGQPPSFFR